MSDLISGEKTIPGSLKNEKDLVLVCFLVDSPLYLAVVCSDTHDLKLMAGYTEDQIRPEHLVSVYLAVKLKGHQYSPC
jgi:hypothetical protein